MGSCICGVEVNKWFGEEIRKETSTISGVERAEYGYQYKTPPRYSLFYTLLYQKLHKPTNSLQVWIEELERVNKG